MIAGRDEVDGGAEPGAHQRVPVTNPVRCCHRSFMPRPAKAGHDQPGRSGHGRRGQDDEGPGDGGLDDDDLRAPVGDAEPDVHAAVGARPMRRPSPRPARRRREATRPAELPRSRPRTMAARTAWSEVGRRSRGRTSTPPRPCGGRGPGRSPGNGSRTRRATEWPQRSRWEGARALIAHVPVDDAVPGSSGVHDARPLRGAGRLCVVPRSRPDGARRAGKTTRCGDDDSVGERAVLSLCAELSPPRPVPQPRRSGRHQHAHSTVADRARSPRSLVPRRASPRRCGERCCSCPSSRSTRSSPARPYVEACAIGRCRCRCPRG